MIEVIIRVKDAVNTPALARIEIENVSGYDSDTADYSVRFGVDRMDGLGLHQRGIHSFPRKKYNVLALLRQALLTLEEGDLELDGGLFDDVPPERPIIDWRRFFR